VEQAVLSLSTSTMRRVVAMLVGEIGLLEKLNEGRHLTPVLICVKL
jgi:hypothetical protein